MEFNTEKLQPIAEQLALLFTQALKQEPEAFIRALETAMRQSLVEIGRMAMGQMLSQAEEAPPATLPCACGGTLHYQRRREAQVESVFGWVTYARAYYAGCTCRQGHAPLDARLGLQPGQVTAGLAALLALGGLDKAFKHAAVFLEQFLLFRVSENTVRKETECFGQLQAQVEAQQREASQNPAWLLARRREQQAVPRRLYGALDGAHVRIEPRKKAKNGSPPEKWREMKVGSWYQVEKVPQSQQSGRHRQKAALGHQALRTKHMQYFCEIGDAEGFGELLWGQGCQRQADLAEEVVFVCDGARWIWRLVAYYFPQATQIVDWFHAEERLEKVAQEALPEPQAATWLEEVRTSLWEGDVPFVIRQCQTFATRSTEAAAAVTYFRNNAHRMAYDQFRAQGYMIGSGPIESGCKQLVSQRLKCAGAQWHVSGANQTAKARTAWLSGSWEELCAQRDQLPLAV